MTRVSTGRRTQLTRQVGEHFVVSELGRMGFIATPFAGNVPDFDLLVVNEAGRTIPVQVKAINGPSWQFSVTTFLEIEVKKNAQTVIGRRHAANADLVYVLILLKRAGEDEVFTLPSFRPE